MCKSSKVGTALLLISALIPTLCVCQIELNNRDQYLDPTIPVNSQNVPVKSVQFYFPLQFFPEVEYLFEFQDSSTVLVSKTYEKSNDGVDSFMMYAKVVPDVYDTFRVNWYSEQLLALQEPLLFNKPMAKEVYRLTWLPTFSNPIAIRIEKDGDQYLLYWKICNGAGGYDPGDLVVNKKKPIQKEEWDRFKTLLSATNYWNLSNLGRMSGFDGSHWIMEGSTQTRYQVVDRWSPGKESDYYKLCSFLLKLSELRN